MTKKLRTLGLAAGLSLSLPAGACAAPAPPATDADPALWVVKDADTTIYLFGTIHVLRPGMSWFDEAVKKAFDASQTLVMEMVPPEEATQGQVVRAKAFLPAGQTLAQQLTPATRTAFDQAIVKYKLSPKTFERMRPWFASISLSVLPLQKVGYGAAAGPETVLTAAAQETGKEIRGLETFEGQLAIFDNLSPAGQDQLLRGTLRELPQAEALMGRMVADWARGDPDALAREMNDTLDDAPEVRRALLTDRNAKWAGWIAERMRSPGTVFVAVGAGHLAGPDSVQAQLAPYNLKAVRIAY